MVHKDRQPAANEHHHKKKIEEVAVAYPYRKAVGSRKVVRIYLRNSRNTRHSGYRNLDPCRHYNGEDRDTDADQDGRSNPKAKTAIRRIMNGFVRVIELDHTIPSSANSPIRRNQN